MRAKSLLILAFFLGALATSAHAKPAPAEMLLKNRKITETGYVTKAEGGKVYFTASASGKNERPYPLKSIERLTFKEPEGWSEAEEARLTKNYAEAEKLYGAIAVDFRQLASLEDNYGSLARLRQLECLRNSGEYVKLARVAPNLKKSGLSERYHAQVDLFVGWAALADLSTDARIDQLELMIDDYRNRDLLPGQLAQAFYLSAVAREKKGDPGRALTDYHRAFTLDFGKDRELAQKAMDSALLLYAEEDKLYRDRQRLEEAHALAATYKKIFGDDVPEKAARFAKPLPPEEES